MQHVGSGQMGRPEGETCSISEPNGESMDRDGENYQCTCIGVRTETLHENRLHSLHFLF